MNEISDLPKHVGDVLSVSVVIGTFVHVLPAIAAAFTIIWTAIRIYETKTVQRLIHRHHTK